MQSRLLNPRQQRFLTLYTGKDPDFHGNATACYRLVYNPKNERNCQAAGSQLLRNPKVKAILDKAEAAAVARLNLNAAFVLNETVRLYDRCMGDELVPFDTTRVDKESGVVEVIESERRQYDPGIARQALEQIGRHTHVQAFQDNVEHSHTHYLEDRLMRRSQAIEARAINADQDQSALLPPVAQVDRSPSDPPAPGASTDQRPIIADPPGPAARPGAARSATGQHQGPAKKECLPAEVKPERRYTGSIPRKREKRA